MKTISKINKKKINFDHFKNKIDERKKLIRQAKSDFHESLKSHKEIVFKNIDSKVANYRHVKESGKRPKSIDRAVDAVSMNCLATDFNHDRILLGIDSLGEDRNIKRRRRIPIS